ncbi:MAG: DNA translocase FtsK [Pseudomonadota bacterium]
MSASMRRLLFIAWGLALLALAGALSALLLSYNVADPSPFSATSEAATNLLGGPGAIVADTLMRYIGLGAWAIVAFAAVWGFRLVFRVGSYRIWARLVAALPFFIIATVFASTHAVYHGWQLGGMGLGGTLGDTGARALLELMPMAVGQSLMVVSICLGLALVVVGALALGFSWGEIRAISRWQSRSLSRATGWIYRAARDGARRANAKIAEVRARPRSEKMEPAEPTGTWRLKMPKVQMPSVQMPSVPMPSMPEALTRRGGEARPARQRSGELSIDRITGDMPDIRPDIREEPVVGFDPDQRDARGPDARDPMLGDALNRAIAEDYSPLGGQRADPETEPALRRAFDRLAEDDPVLEAGIAAQRPPIERPAQPVAKSRRAEAERQPSLALDASDAAARYEPPALALLQKPANIIRTQTSDIALEENARMLETVLEDYGVRGEIVAVRPGPVVTLYELEPAPGLKASRVIGLADDIARSMSALAARVSTVPGRSIIGIELPNADREKVWLRDLFEAKAYGDSRYPLALALGKDISGSPIVSNLAKMPHLLIAGTTGSGKSVAINTMILSLLYRLGPDQCRMIMIDPKMLELSVYDNIPHLLAPVVTDPKKAIVALKWVVAEMEERYRKLAKVGVRNIDGYNARVRDALSKGEDFSRTVQTGFDDETGEPIYETETFEPQEMPFIVVVVDEMADLMMVAGKEIEACIQRLAQMARASGIHLIMATQRPSVDVITGTIKANFPTRISFQVTSKIDSRTILGEQGAEQLLGQGDMLYMEGGGRIRRVHGPFVSDEEVEEVVAHLKSLGKPYYVGAVTEGVDDEAAAAVDAKLGLAASGSSEDELYDMAVAIVARDRKCSTSYIQRKLAIGYNKAARLVEQMEDQGVVTSANAVGKREILVEER